MRPTILMLCCMAAPLPLAGCTQYGDAYGSSYASGFGPAPDIPFHPELRYRDDPRYREHVLRRGEAIYAGEDGRYYCRHRDGTTGLIVGDDGGKALATSIAPGGSRTVDAMARGGGNAAIDLRHLRCR